VHTLLSAELARTNAADRLRDGERSAMRYGAAAPNITARSELSSSPLLHHLLTLLPRFGGRTASGSSYSGVARLAKPAGCSDPDTRC
jgi:hypothetical protein